jgi:proteasome accessory factor B
MADKYERLLDLLMTLLAAPKPLTAAELRARVPGYPENDASFRRAFERDKESLREMHVPLLLTEVTHTDPPTEGYRVRPEDYYLRDPGLEPDELAALHLAATAVTLDSAHGIEALWKLGAADEGTTSAAGGGSDRSGAGADPEDGHRAAASSGPLVSLPDDPNLGPLFAAIGERRTATFTYRDDVRHLDPYRLDFQRGRWHLTGWDRDRGELRNYRLDRVHGRVTTSGPAAFDRPADGVRGGPAQPWELGTGESRTARIAVDADQAPWVCQHVGADRVVETADDGAVVIELEVNNWSALRSFVLTFLEHAEIVSPPDLRDRMVDWLEHIS